MACLEVDVSQRIHLVHHDVDVVAADAGRYNRYALALVSAGNGAELAALNGALLGLEVRSHEVNASRVAHKNHLVGELFGLNMQVEDAAIFVDDEFRLSKIFLLHNPMSFLLIVYIKLV